MFFFNSKLCKTEFLYLLLIPMGFCVFVKRREHDRQYGIGIVTYQTHYILVVPVVESPLGDLNKVKEQQNIFKK